MVIDQTFFGIFHKCLFISFDFKSRNNECESTMGRVKEKKVPPNRAPFECDASFDFVAKKCFQPFV